MNKIFRVIWNSALALWTVASEFGRGHGKSSASSPGVALVAAGLLAAASFSASAACTSDTVANAITCSGSDEQTTTVGAGLATPQGTTVSVASGSKISTGNSAGISVGNAASVVVQGGATVQNSATNKGTSPYGNIGANAIEVNNNSTITIEEGAFVIASGAGTSTEAINPVGSGNTITNHGTISSTHAAIWFQAASGNNTVVNNGTIIAGAGTNSTVATVIGASGTMAVDFTNSGHLVGSLAFANGNDVLRWHTGASMTGNISGGGGANLLTLESADGAAATFAPLSLGGFQTLQSNAGIWSFNVA
ncbi:ESPR domain-containing protein, partial [Variovorax boronicumulans]|uniref:ESPR domain-containing protein n=1 Tax=Variovorax boronicumulans TaxID=436515 RepID=UPI003398E7EA